MMDDFGTTFRSKVADLPSRPGTRRDAELKKFTAYWSSMRKGGDVPMRTEIDPRGIESLLGNAFIAEKVAPGIARLRIAGTHLSEVMGMEVRGMPLSALIDPEDRAAVENRAARAGTVQLLSAITGEGMAALSDAIIARLAGQTHEEALTLRFDEGRKRAWLFEKGLVEAETQDEEGYTLTVRWNDIQKAQFEAL